MLAKFSIFFVAISLIINDCKFISECEFPIVSREEWGARPPKAVNAMQNPVPHVVIHHSHSPKTCNTTELCIQAMQRIQNLHQNVRGWDDIGYSFAVGGDGKVYSGREWSKVGAHSPSYNDKSIGICLIGDWELHVPPKHQLDMVHKLIKCGVLNDKIQSNYTLFGHRQVREGTVCPGDALFREIKTWYHFSSDPPSVWRPNATDI